MTCPEFVTSQTARRGIGAIQPQSGLDYPLTAPSPDIRGLIADLQLTFDDPGEYSPAQPKAQPPYRLRYLYNVGCEPNTPPAGFPAPPSPNAADIEIVDAADRVIFTTFSGTVTRTVRNWGNDYKIYGWNKERQSCSLIVYTTWLPTEANDIYHDEPTRKHYQKFLAPISAQIVSRAVYKMPKRVLTLKVRNRASVSEPYTGKINFKNGYNTTITAANTTVADFRINTAVTFSAVPGSGAGKYVSCPDTSIEVVPLRRINGISGLKGDFLIAATDCLWARKPVATTTATGGVLSVAPGPVPQQIGADCPPCCECIEYSDTAEYMNTLGDFYAEIGRRVSVIREQHQKNIDVWVAQQECSRNPLRLLLVPQRCPYMDIVAMLCNPCQECVESTNLTIDIVPETTALAAEVVPGKTALYGGVAGVNGRPITVTAAPVIIDSQQGTRFTTQLPKIAGGGSAYIQFQVKFAAKVPNTISGTLTAVTVTGDTILTGCATNSADSRIIAQATDSKSLFCSPAGATEIPV
jgi:hypothetical protein